MDFGGFFSLIVWYLLILLCFALVGVLFHFFVKKDEEQTQSRKLSKIYKACPCQKAVQSGFMSKLCTLSGVFAFMLSLTNLALIGNFSLQNYTILALSLTHIALGWVLKK